MAVRKPKKLTNQKDIDYFLSLKEEDITKSFIMETFGEFDGSPKYNPYDEIVIPKGHFTDGKYKNEKEFTTTVGSYIFNVFFIQKELIPILGYINDEFTKSTMGKINSKMSYALLEDDITIDMNKRYLNKTQVAMPWISVLSTNQTISMLTLSNKIEPLKKELNKKYKKEIEEGDIAVASKMEKELLDKAEEILKEDESFDWIRSGYRASWENNIKNMYVMKGAMKDPITGKYNIAMSNYASGMSKEEYKLFCNSLAEGPYARSNKTAIGGYWEKLLLSAYQHVILLKEGSDCKTTNYLEVDFSTEDPKDYIYSYIVKGSQFEEITSKNMNSFKGKKVKIRYSSLCSAKNGICHRCAGNFFNRLGLENVGMVMPILGSTLKNLCMKSFHDSTISLHEIDVNKAFGF